MKIGVQIILNVDQPVADLGQAMFSLISDVSNNASVFKYIEDVLEKISPMLWQVGTLSSDIKSNPDNRRYLAAAVEETCELFLLPLPNRPATQAADAVESKIST